jgi:hypothetical protein
VITSYDTHQNLSQSSRFLLYELAIIAANSSVATAFAAEGICILDLASISCVQCIPKSVRRFVSNKSLGTTCFTSVDRVSEEHCFSRAVCPCEHGTKFPLRSRHRSSELAPSMPYSRVRLLVTPTRYHAGSRALAATLHPLCSPT